MFPQFASTAASFTRATSLMNRVGTDAYLYDEPEDGNIAVLLDSKFEQEKVEGMKRLISLLSQGRDVSTFFPQVVKNVATTSLEVKKLVYIYLVHYAEKRPDEALLSINSFQKDLSDLNPLVRAWALRAMSGIRVRVVVPLIVMAVTKCSRDPSPYVRRCSAHAIPKIYAIERDSHKEVLHELVGLLLSDSSPSVIGAAASAFMVICPENLALLAPRFRKLCEMLPDVDEWGQVVLLDILMRYAVARYDCVRGAKEGLGMETFDNERELPGEIRGLLHWSSSLLRSQNSAVVMAVAGVHWVFAPTKDLKSIVKPLLFLLRSSYDSQYVVLANIATFALQAPSLFADYFEEFFVRSCDTDSIRALKLDVLTTIATESSIHAILQEFQAYVRDSNREFAANTVSAIGRCAVRIPAVRPACVEGLLTLARGVFVGDAKEATDPGLNKLAQEKPSQEAGVVAQAVLALRSIVQQNPAEQEQVLARLVRLLDHMKVPEARAVVIWLVGEESLNSQRISQMLPIVLRYLAGCFTKEADQTKLQILNCSAKIVLRLEEAPASPLKETASLVLAYTLDLGDNDMNNDIRDRARLLRHLVLPQSVKKKSSSDLAQQLQSLEVHDEATTTTASQEEPRYAHKLPKLAKQLLLVPKSPPVLPALAPDRSSFLPGTMSHIVNHNAPGYTPLPEPHSLNVDEDTTREANTGGESSSEEDSSEYSDEGGSEVSGSEDNKTTPSTLAPLISMDDEHDTGLPVRDLDSWLDAPDAEPQSSSLAEVASGLLGFATLTLGPLNPVLNKSTLLDYTNGDGLDVQYSYIRAPGPRSQDIVALQLYFSNRSGESMLKISVKGNNSDQATEEISFEEIAELAAGSTTERELHVVCKHQLTPIKLAIVVNEKTYPVKLTLEVGALLRPFPMTRKEFPTAQSRISGMHESSRRCTLAKSYFQASDVGEDKVLLLSRAIATGVLKVAHVAVVSATLPITDSPSLSGLELCFAGETLVQELLCLISVTLDGAAVLAKVNCEDAVLGLSLLKQLETVLTS